MAKRRKMLGLNILKQAGELVDKGIPISTVVKVLELESKYKMHYRSAFDIIKADIKCHYKATRPNWLREEPAVQEAPYGDILIDGFDGKGYWKYNGGNNIFYAKKKGEK